MLLVPICIFSACYFVAMLSRWRSFLTLGLLLMIATARSQITSFPYFESFETGSGIWTGIGFQRERSSVFGTFLQSI